jgi:CRP-like cAMP-binding protein
MAGPAVSFLDSLDAGSRELLMAVAQPVGFVKGTLLVRQGDPARGAYVVREGEVEAIVTLPGGESLTVARLGPGGVFGEMALVELGICTASVRAVSAVEGWFIGHEEFRALGAQRGDAALAIQRALTGILAGKLGALNARLAACAAPEDRPVRRVPAGDPLAEVARSKAPFGIAPFLARLPVFGRFSSAEIDEVASRGGWLEIPRGAALFHAGGEASAAFIVVRGAVEIVAPLGDCERRMAVLGPGTLVGYLAVLDERRHSTHAFAREGALLLEIPAPAFRELYAGAGGASVRMRHAVQTALLAALARTNRALTRLVSQAQLVEVMNRSDRAIAANLRVEEAVFGYLDPRGDVAG